MSEHLPALPLRDFPQDRLRVRKEHLLREVARPQPRLSPRRRVALAVLVALVAIGTATAATTSWLRGGPVPPAVVSDFGSYAPQLGFHPDPGRAVLVAQDGHVSLYATTNAEGSYCLVTSAPWKRPETLPDGGTCIPPAQAAAPLVAGLVGASSDSVVVAGRTTSRDARTIRFTDVDGNPVTRTVGSSGFFVADVHFTRSPCAHGDWRPSFAVLDPTGRELTRTHVTLARAAGLGACVLPGPHG
ncbi:MAG TPA: hypothetical protein VE596_09255 [Gaiellaceae bacterium]|nr:hypothetical protein [Gaiellaceae bacterium]